MEANKHVVGVNRLRMEVDTMVVGCLGQSLGATSLAAARHAVVLAAAAAAAIVRRVLMVVRVGVEVRGLVPTLNAVHLD